MDKVRNLQALDPCTLTSQLSWQGFMILSQQAIGALQVTNLWSSTFTPTGVSPARWLLLFLEELAVKYQDQVDVYKVNVDMEQEIAAYYKISSIPTFFFVDSDGEVSVDLGYKPKEYFEQRILTMIGETNEATVN